MSIEFSMAPIGEVSGADGMDFIANVNGKKVSGRISRTVLSLWAVAADEPLLSIFVRKQDAIEAAARNWHFKNPGLTIVLGSADF